MNISNHHILYDGWSNGIILKEFFSAFHKQCQGVPSPEVPIKPLFKEFIRWLQNQDRTKQEQYWREYLAGFETRTELPIQGRKEEPPGAEDYSLDVEKDIKGKLDAFVENIGFPVYQATRRVLSCPGVITTSGWKEGMNVDVTRAMEYLQRHIHVFTHAGNISESQEAVSYAEKITGSLRTILLFLIGKICPN
jgi:hypothetical protein